MPGENVTNFGLFWWKSLSSKSIDICQTLPNQRKNNVFHVALPIVDRHDDLCMYV